jgi:hypothetical protein
VLWLVLLFIAIWLFWFMRRRGRAVVPVVTTPAWPDRATDAAPQPTAFDRALAELAGAATSAVADAVPADAQSLVRRLTEVLAPAASPAREPLRTSVPKAARRAHGMILPPTDATHALVPAAPAMRATSPLAARPALHALAPRAALKPRQPLAPHASHPSLESHPSHASR